MSIKEIERDKLREMNGEEGLILQGCGGNLVEWLNGVNESFQKIGILKNNTAFKDCFCFKDDNITCLLFPFDENVNVDISKLAVWRMSTKQQFGGMWLSDYVDNRLGGFEDENDRVRIEAPEMFRVMGKRKPECIEPYIEKLRKISETDENEVVRIHSKGAIRATIGK